MRPVLPWRALAIVLLIVAYALGSHYLMVWAAASPWSALALCGPLLVVVSLAALRRRHWPTIAVCVALLLGLVVMAARGNMHDIHRLYVLQHGAVQLALAWTFGITLRRGSTALISQLADIVHDGIDQRMAAYTRRLTAIWTAYFLTMVLCSVLLYGLASWDTWSAFGNLASPLLALGLFAGEFAIRPFLHPEFARASMADAIRAYRRRLTPQGPVA